MFWLRSMVGVSLVLPPFRIHVSHKLARCGSLTAESISIIIWNFGTREMRVSTFGIIRDVDRRRGTLYTQGDKIVIIHVLIDTDTFIIHI